MQLPAVDILLASYNGEAFIAEQIDSILNQSFTDFRLIIRDDGSTDATLEIVDAVCAAHPDRVSRVIDTLSNLGAAGNFAALIGHSRAPYVMFSDQDDVWFPDKIEATLEVMQREETAGGGGAVLVYTDVVIVDALGREIAPSYFAYSGIEAGRTAYPALFLQNIVIGCTAMANRRLLDRAMPIPPAAVMHDWWLAIVAAGLGRIAMLDRPTLNYRQHGGNEVGAWRYGLASVWQLSPDRLRTARRNYLSAIAQAGVLLERFASSLRPDQLAIAEGFIELPAANWVMRRIKARRLGVRKSGKLRTLLLYSLM